jgi:hypothetical protein
VFFGYRLLALLWTVMTVKTFVIDFYFLLTDPIWFSKMFPLQQPLNSSCLFCMRLIIEPSFPCVPVPLCAPLGEDQILFGSIVYGLFSPPYCLFYSGFVIEESTTLFRVCFLPLTFVPLSNRKRRKKLYRGCMCIESISYSVHVE